MVHDTPRMGVGPIATLYTAPVERGVIIYPGQLVSLNGRDNAVPAESQPGWRTLGVNEGPILNNSGGAAGDIIANSIRAGVYRFDNAGGCAERSHIGQVCYVADDHTADVLSVRDGKDQPLMGLIVDVDKAGVWVEIRLGHAVIDTLLHQLNTLRNRIIVLERTR